MINDIEITNVEQSEQYPDEGLFLFFDLNDYPYFLSLSKNKQGIFGPTGIFHNSEDVCPWCEREKPQYLGCNTLDPQRQALFLRLIEHPSIRLNWVFLSHSEESV